VGDAEENVSKPYGQLGRTKRQKELARAAKQREKEARRAERQAQKKERPEGEDPDIAGIVPGPQPPRED
jgi:chromatin segregation and condensation protein Rec8/ScpA/Scc1 (kleisin family)